MSESLNPSTARWAVLFVGDDAEAGKNEIDSAELDVDAALGDGIEAPTTSRLGIALTTLDDESVGAALELVDRCLLEWDCEEITLVAMSAGEDQDSVRRIRWLEFACEQRQSVHGVLLKTTERVSTSAAWSLLVDRRIRQRLTDVGAWVSLDCRDFALPREEIAASIAKRIAGRLTAEGGLDPEAPELESAIASWLDRGDTAHDSWREAWRGEAARRTWTEATRWITAWGHAAGACLGRDRERSDRINREWAEFAENLGAREKVELKRRVRQYSAGILSLIAFVSLLVAGLAVTSSWLVSGGLLGVVAVVLYFVISSRITSDFEVDRRALPDLRLRSRQLSERVELAEKLQLEISSESLRLRGIRESAVSFQNAEVSRTIERLTRCFSEETDQLAEELTRTWLEDRVDVEDAMRSLEAEAAALGSAAPRDPAYGPALRRWLEGLDADFTSPLRGPRWSVFSGWVGSLAGEKDIVRDGPDEIIRVAVEGAGDLAGDLRPC